MRLSKVLLWGLLRERSIQSVVITGKGNMTKRLLLPKGKDTANQPVAGKTVAGKMGKMVGRKLASELAAGQEERQ
jgi:hypothetical protein